MAKCITWGGEAKLGLGIECIALAEELACRKLSWSYCENSRVGDHVCYITDMRKFQADYPGWRIRKNLREIVEELVCAEQRRTQEKTAIS